jgi:hypothetical protein
MGRRKWKQYQDVVLKTPLKVEIEDWEPQDKCCMCDGRAFLDSATVSRTHFNIILSKHVIWCDLSVSSVSCDVEIVQYHRCRCELNGFDLRNDLFSVHKVKIIFLEGN